MKTSLNLCLFLFFLVPQLSAVDFGDHTSSTLTSKAWKALGKNNHLDVASYVNKCLELYATQAKSMQAKLTEPADKANAHEYWALNDVGTCLFILGESQLKEGKKTEALKTYKNLVDNYKYAQCWDTKGWFWQPAQAAKQKIVELEFDFE